MSIADPTSYECSPAHLQFPGMSQAVRRGRVVMVSGQVALDTATEIVSDDPLEQAQQCFVNIELALKCVGARLEHVTKLVCYLTDSTHYPAYLTAKVESLPGATPVSTTVVVSSLLHPRMLIEVEAWAHVEDNFVS